MPRYVLARSRTVGMGHDVVPELAERRAEAQAQCDRTGYASAESGYLFPRVDAVSQRPGASAYEGRVGGFCCDDTLSGAAPVGGRLALGSLDEARRGSL